MVHCFFPQVMHWTTWPAQCQNSTALLKTAHPIQCPAQTRPSANMLQLNSMIEIGRGTHYSHTFEFLWIHSSSIFRVEILQTIPNGESALVVVRWVQNSHRNYSLSVKDSQLISEIKQTWYVLGMLTRAVRPCLTSLSWDIWHQNSELSPVKLCLQLWLGCVHFRGTGHLRIITGSTPGMHSQYYKYLKYHDCRVAGRKFKGTVEQTLSDKIVVNLKDEASDSHVCQQLISNGRGKL